MKKQTPCMNRIEPQVELTTTPNSKPTNAGDAGDVLQPTQPPNQLGRGGEECTAQVQHHFARGGPPTSMLGTVEACDSCSLVGK